MSFSILKEDYAIIKLKIEKKIFDQLPKQYLKDLYQKEEQKHFTKKNILDEKSKFCK